MKMPFEIWIETRQYGRSVTALFEEAFTCYRNAAYRASLLFSYLGFMTIIKETIIRSAKPTAIPQSRWDRIILLLQNDDHWEKTVFEELVNGTSPVFNINDSIRQQIKYWKDRRNDSAHFKTNEIESYHTESFWSFIKSNLLKISVEGGTQNLLNKLERHYDPTFTPPNKDVAPMVREIDETVEPIKLAEFWEDLSNRIDYLGFSYFGETDFTLVIKSVFENCSDVVRENLAHYLKAKKFDLYIVYYYPDKINQLQYSSAETREVWRTRIWENKSSAFSIYATLLRNGLIPKKEIPEANLHVIASATDQRPQDESTHLALAGNGFGDTIFQIAFIDKRLQEWLHFINPRADMIAYYIERYPLRDETVEIICEMYTRANYSWWLAERISRIFEELPEKKEEFHQIAASKGYKIPSALS
jgi:hypothetical protein